MSDPMRMLEVSTKNHQMIVLRDDGLYRHIRFAEPGTSIWHFDLVTWPGHLVVTGDLEDFHFARIRDMFEFFRRPVGYVNPSYWGEKLRGPVRTKSFAPERFRQFVYEAFRHHCGYNLGPHAPLWQAIRSELLDNSEIYDDSAAHTAVNDFTFRGVDANGQVYAFDFVDSWEWDFTDYDFHFLLSLHAIVWGINQYDDRGQATVS